MRRGRRTWLWLLVPILGGAAMLAAPPMDEYAPLDRIGTRFDPSEANAMPPQPDAPAEFRAAIDRMNRESEEFARKQDEANGIARHRGWKIHLPEAAARRAIARLFSPQAGWQNVGGGTGSSSEGERRSTSVTTIYMNDATGDQAEVEATTQIAPTRGPPSIQVSVSQSKSSLEPWPRIKRWARRLFGR